MRARHIRMSSADALHLAGQHVDVDVGALELFEDPLELGNRLAVADRLVAHSTTSLVIAPSARVVTTRLPTRTSLAARTTAPLSVSGDRVPRRERPRRIERDHSGLDAVEVPNGGTDRARAID